MQGRQQSQEAMRIRKKFQTPLGNGTHLEILGAYVVVPLKVRLLRGVFSCLLE